MSDINSIAVAVVQTIKERTLRPLRIILQMWIVKVLTPEVTLAENLNEIWKIIFRNEARIGELYDEFIENSLRNSSSELNQQNPIVDYANRVINILGNENLSLTSAFDTFFNSARELSLNPSSLVQKGLFYIRRGGIDSPFKEISVNLI